MSELFIPGNTRATATADTRQRANAEAPDQGLSAREGDFSRTLQTQIVERRQQERRSDAGPPRPASAEQTARGGPYREPARTEAPPPAQPARGHKPEGASARDAEAAADPKTTESAPDAADETAAAPADPAAAAAAGTLLAAQVAANLAPKAQPVPTEGASTAQAASALQTGLGKAVAHDSGAATGEETTQDGSGDAAPSPQKATTGPQDTATPKFTTKPEAAPDGDAEPAADMRARPAPMREVAPPRADIQAQAIRAEGATSAAQSSLPDAGATSSQAIGQAAASGVQHRSVATSAAPTPTAFISTPADQSGFADEVGQRVVLYAGRGESKAELILTPAHLGRVEVSLTVSAEQATAQFLASSNAAREALEAALPRLREMLAEAGIHLGESQVGTQSEQQGGDGRRGGGFRGSDFASGADTMSEGSRHWIRQGNGMIDTFA